VLRLLDSAGAGGLTRSEFYRRTHFLGDRRDAVVAALTAAEDIEVSVIPTKTRPRSIYRRIM